MGSKSERRLVMKARWMTLLTGTLMLISLAAYQPAGAAPAGELTIVSYMIGNQVPLPWEEATHANDWIKLLYDPLVGTTPDASCSTEMGLAEKWEMSPDGLTWTFFLKKGVKFHDGVEVTAKDAKFSIERAMGPDSKANTAGDLRAAIKSMEVNGTHTLVVTCKRPSLFLPELFSDIGTCAGSVAPKDSYEKVGRDQFVKNPIGSGPYKFHSQLIGSFIKLEATDKHWRDGVPRYKYVTFRIIPEESTQIAMLKTGEADIARVGRERVKEVLEAGFNVVSKKNAAIVTFQPNMQWTSPAFADVRFRKALTLAIDRETIIKHIFGGMASPTTNYPGANIFGVKGAPTLKPYPYDPEQARRLIKEGGYEGFEFIVPIYTRAGCPEIPRVVETVYSYWTKIGVKPKTLNMEAAKWIEMERGRKVQGYINCSDSMTCPALSELLSRFSQNLHSKWPRTMINDPKADGMIDRAEKSLDRTEVEKITVDLYRYTYENYIYIPVCDIDDMIATNRKVPKWEPGYRRVDRNINDIIRQR
jgi:peptide/nickel transport system substrate-binding protein